jgi:hypothetical protein
MRSLRQDFLGIVHPASGSFRVRLGLPPTAGPIGVSRTRLGWIRLDFRRLGFGWTQAASLRSPGHRQRDALQRHAFREQAQVG